MKQNKLLNHLVLPLVVVGFSAPVTVMANDTEDLSLQIEKLSKEINALKEQTKKSTKSNAIKVGLELIQFDYNRFDGAYNGNNDGATGSDFFPRRVWVSAKSKIDNWSYLLLTGFQESNASIVIARLTYSGFKNGPLIKIGKIREDISIEALMSNRDITTISRSMLSNVMSPFFNYGVSASQYFNKIGLRYAIGVYKANEFGSNGFDQSDSLNLAYTGRLTWAPINDEKTTLHFGTWYSHRDFGGDTLAGNFARGEVRSSNVRLLSYAAGGETYAVDKLNQFGLEFAGVYGPLSIQAEYAERDVEAVDDNNNNTFDSFYITASYFLTGERRGYKTKGTFVNPTPLSTSGAWEIYTKFSSFDATSVNQGTKVDVFTLGVSYYLNKQMKFMVNHIDSKVSGPGVNALPGQFSDGKAITARLQYLF